MSAIPAIKAALEVVMRDLWPAAHTTYGPPTNTLADEVAVIESADAVITRPTAGGARRSREEEVEVVVVVSCYRIGDDHEVQGEASAAAWEMVRLLEEWLRTRGNETLNGVCRDAWISKYSERPYRLADPDSYSVGRACDVTVTVTANTRI